VDVDRGEDELVVKSRPVSRGEATLLIVTFSVMTALSLVLSAGACRQAWPEGPANVIPVALVGGSCVLIWPAIAVLAYWDPPRGTWRLDGDGVSLHPTRGTPVAVRWKEVEWVKWGGLRVVLQDGRRTLRLPFDVIDEPARSSLAGTGRLLRLVYPPDGLLVEPTTNLRQPQPHLAPAADQGHGRRPRRASLMGQPSVGSKSLTDLMSEEGSPSGLPESNRLGSAKCYRFANGR
jgi:hypothetical protein